MVFTHNMSYFIANNISFNKDFTEFRVKGGDNNVSPRSNEWTKFFPIEELYYNISSRCLQFNNLNQEKKALVDHLVFENDFGGSFNDGTDYYHVYHSNRESLKEFDDKFVAKLRHELKNIDNKTKYIIRVGHIGYIVSKFGRSGFYISENKDNAMEFTKYVALCIKDYKYFGDVEIIKV